MSNCSGFIIQQSCKNMAITVIGVMRRQDVLWQAIP